MDLIHRKHADTMYRTLKLLQVKHTHSITHYTVFLNVYKSFRVWSFFSWWSDVVQRTKIIIEFFEGFPKQAQEQFEILNRLSTLTHIFLVGYSKGRRVADRITHFSWNIHSHSSKGMKNAGTLQKRCSFSLHFSPVSPPLSLRSTLHTHPLYLSVKCSPQVAPSISSSTVFSC